MPFTDHNGREFAADSGERHEPRHPVSAAELSIVVGPNIIAQPVDVSAFGMAVLLPPGCTLPDEVSVRLIFGDAMQTAHGPMRVAGPGVPVDGAVRVGLEVCAPGPVADLLKQIFTQLERRDAA